MPLESLTINQIARDLNRQLEDTFRFPYAVRTMLQQFLVDCARDTDLKRHEQAAVALSALSKRSAQLATHFDANEIP